MRVLLCPAKSEHLRFSGAHDGFQNLFATLNGKKQHWHGVRARSVNEEAEH
jgi:hypothetical protein